MARDAHTAFVRRHDLVRRARGWPPAPVPHVTCLRGRGMGKSCAPNNHQLKKRTYSLEVLGQLRKDQQIARSLHVYVNILKAHVIKKSSAKWEGSTLEKPAHSDLMTCSDTLWPGNPHIRKCLSSHMYFDCFSQILAHKFLGSEKLHVLT